MVVPALQVDGKPPEAGNVHNRDGDYTASLHYGGYRSLNVGHEPIRPDHRRFSLPQGRTNSD